MPVYEYRCKKCSREFEYTQRMSDAPKKKCEACGGGLERLISMTSFQLKGSGWYKDLYSSAPGASASGGDDAGSSDGGDAAETKSDAKGDAKSDAKGDAKSDAKSDAKPAKADAKPDKKPAKPGKKPVKASSKGK